MLVSKFLLSTKNKFWIVDCSSKQCLCIYKCSNTHGIANLPCVFCLLGCSPNPCEHHGTVMAVHSYSVLKERFAETRSLHRHDAEQQVWAVPNKLLQGKGLCIYKAPCLARELRRTRMVPRSTACRSHCIHLNCQFRSQLLYWTHQIFFRRQWP